MKLLIVEDSKLVSSRLQLAFGKIAALETEIADRLGLALERFRTLQPEIVILDIELPDGNGLDLLQTIKRERPATRVLMFSNHDFFRQRCTIQGADYFFDKSWEFEALTSTVQSLEEGQEFQCPFPLSRREQEIEVNRQIGSQQHEFLQTNDKSSSV